MIENYFFNGDFFSFQRTCENCGQAETGLTSFPGFCILIFGFLGATLGFIWNFMTILEGTFLKFFNKAKYNSRIPVSKLTFC